jgi:hypothetical protein
MMYPSITPIHRPQVPEDLLDKNFVTRHLDDAETLAALGMADVRQAAEHYRAKLRQVAGNEWCGRLLVTQGDLLETQGDSGATELEEICRNVLTLRAHMHVKHDYGKAIDWTTVVDGDIESNVAINHHWHIAALAMAYRRGGERRYAAHAVEMLRSWFEQSPAPTDKAELQWRTLEVGGRLTQAWPIVGVCLCDYEGFTDRDLFDLVRWTWLSVQHLRRFVGPPNNWLQIESIGSLCGLAFLGDILAARRLSQEQPQEHPQAHDAWGWHPGKRAPETVISGWADLFWKRLEWINREQFLPDGMQAENSPGYHTFPWWRLYSAGVWIEMFGGTLPAGYWAEQVQRAQPLWMVRQPDGALPVLSDCGPQPTRADRLLAFVREHQPGADLPDPAALAEKGELPAGQRVCHLPYAGYTVCRSGWDKDAEYLLFDHGFYGTNHQHEDKLTFLYAAGGRMLVGDGGIYRYSNDDWEHYFRGAYSHNAVMVDGKQQCRTLRAWQGKTETIPDADASYRVTPGGAVVLSGWYREGFALRLHHLWERAADRSDELASLDASIQHQRVLVWLPGKGVLVIDRLTGEGEHLVEQVFHLEPFVEKGEAGATFQPGRVVVRASVGCLLAEGSQPGVVLIASEHAPATAQEHGTRGSDAASAWVDRCGQKEPPRGWTSLYGLQPSYDLWRGGKVRLPVTQGAWIQAWPSDAVPGQARLEMRTAGEVVEFSVTVGESGVVRAAVNLADLRLELA